MQGVLGVSVLVVGTTTDRLRVWKIDEFGEKKKHLAAAFTWL